jgi:hypothetical protein
MKNNLQIYLLIILGFVFVDAVAQNNTKQKMPVLFTDRDFCVSGDTVWVKVFQPEQLENFGNIVHVQLDGKNNNLISSIAIKTENNRARGFISIPDSLSTGQYFITAFLNAQRNTTDLEISGKSLFVYNRFEDRVEEIELIEQNNLGKIKINNSAININTYKNEYLTREKVAVKIDTNSGFKIKNAIIRAALVDPLTKEIEIESKFKLQSSNSDIPGFIENDGILLNGKVIGKNGEAPANALVLLSIDGDKPYFDYYVLGENGDFHFYIKNAFGNGNVVLQAVSNNAGQFTIQLDNNFMVHGETNQYYLKTLNPKQIDFINTSINANLTNKIFNTVIETQPVNFEMLPRFSIPFYGKPDQHVIPDEFIDLPDFQEISREILPGVQYRSRNDETTIRVVNSSYRLIFEDEPLRLINGIPVFKNDFFKNLKSTDISFIDIVKAERIFGDLIFKGVLSVSLYDKSNSWLAQQPNVFQFNVDFIQTAKTPNYEIQNNLHKNQPDMRQVFLWEILKEGQVDYGFNLSDRKGTVEITVEGLTTDDEFFKSSKLIEIK